MPAEPDFLVSSANQLQQLLTATSTLARPTSSTPTPRIQAGTQTANPVTESRGST